MFSKGFISACLMAVGVLGIERVQAQEQATASAGIEGGVVKGVTVTAGGSGYRSVPSVLLTGGGGTGAAATAVLKGGRVALINIIEPGNGYTDAPTVNIAAPPKAGTVAVGSGPSLLLTGPPGGTNRVEWSSSPTGPWLKWTNFVVGALGQTVVDLSAAGSTKFFRTVVDSTPEGFVYVPPGTFLMGSPIWEDGRDDDETQHEVTLTRGFWISDHETTQAEYESVMGNNPSTFKGSQLPVEMVSWRNAVAYCEQLTAQERAAGRITSDEAYRLPTESEWEYACRAGSTGAYCGDLEAIAWFFPFSSFTTADVKSLKPNNWGLYDMSGNVAEWCEDWYGAYPSGPVTDPTGPSSGQYRVFRGGSWNDGESNLRSADRDGGLPDKHDSYSLGLRPVFSSAP